MAEPSVDVLLRLPKSIARLLQQLSRTLHRTPDQLLTDALIVYLERVAAEQESLEQRFWSRVRKARGCWLWTGSANRLGYGLISRSSSLVYDLGPRQIQAHRFSYELAYGPIPEGLVIRHICNRPSCVRPEHLAAGTQQDNVDDRERAKRTARGLTNGKSKLTPEKVLEIRRRRQEGATNRDLAKEYGVSATTIGAACRGETWSYLPDAFRSGKRHGSAVRNSKLKAADIREIVDRWKSGESQGSLAVDFKVHKALISRILKGQSWSSVTGGQAANRPREGKKQPETTNVTKKQNPR